MAKKKHEKPVDLGEDALAAPAEPAGPPEPPVTVFPGDSINIGTVTNAPPRRPFDENDLVINVETDLVGIVESFDAGDRTFVLAPLAYFPKGGVPSRVKDMQALPTVHATAAFVSFYPNA